ncbi:UDP-glucose 6-dehydrogenase [Candidatus Roizmanbacteria bacterium RIFCSPLOWO2_01_FULL_37_13]|uniref:UDP-glucose 6-dehydrogenase n=1 Tax=Candidatus Roizmanbacteria bacterium RIFCSPHIGHO2_02_FULL_38_11 TaxID=1802039 RepID=A0A1F7H180_9BACT|nr:MAG: UDP-glucose 6-dehydrogenase [Candidatus Roizmanbacteria bacterium RIFCSPHIGHO2_02_FULL_38_11]OGK41408.1 MAG: UDP-glucose 6-dehydrogenase [Candidatus Roizmanbacteria bacterium RIFCSPLOWO2_01_FULL_37_13]
MTITFIGHGYVGLVSACVFADFGNKVWVIGHTGQKIERLKKGDPIIYEPGLKELLEKNLTAKRIFFTLDYETAIAESDIVFIAVGTPPKEDGEADLSNVFKVAKNIARHLKKGLTVVSCKSTVPVGTNKKIETVLGKSKPKLSEVQVSSCPEFLREGSAIYDTLNPDRVVIGSDSKKAIETLIDLHKPIGGKRVITDLASAELIKYTSNAMLATKISFANFIAFYCQKTGADVENVLDAVGLDKRIGRIFMDPGVGYGGSCLPKDVRALIKIGSNLNLDTIFLEAVDRVNIQSQENFLNKILQNVKTKIVALWGLTFKPNTDDIREAPSILIIRKLLEYDFTIKVFDPEGIHNIKKVFDQRLIYCNNPYEAVKDTSGLAVLTEWNEFKQADLKKVRSLMKKPLVFDGRNIYHPQMMKKLGFTYFSVGRPPV